MQKSSFTTSIPEIDSVVDKLCQNESLETVWLQISSTKNMPSIEALHEIMERLRAVIFPGYFGSRVNIRSIKYHIAANIDSVYRLLSDQIERGFKCACTLDGTGKEEDSYRDIANRCTFKLIESLPTIRELLTKDAQAAYEGDPAAVSPGETIFCYPSLFTMFHHRISHVLYQQKIPLIPRMIQEMAHSRTGIDIHPGATIGSHFFIDHGTGVVIGETSEIGHHCRIYQGVTLGALSFPKNKDGTLIKGIARHPVLGDHVTVYAGATILGRVHIGDNSVIGGNVWVTEDVPAGSHVIQKKADQ